ncbi:MAG: trypsin-like peptidase domain-containing protein [Patescibacteria group bacterium]|nr:trypsin-like peptidase domain-containing protein [Patescibacteria group bacterium]
MDNNFKKSFITILIISIIISSVFGGVMGFCAGSLTTGEFNVMYWINQMLLSKKTDQQADKLDNIFNSKKVVKVEEESAVIAAVEKVSPAVVSIIVTKALPAIEQYYQSPFGSDFFREFFGNDFGDFFGFGAPQYRQKGTEKREIGGGTGFIVSQDGYIVTNKHVVYDEEAEYTVLMNDESKHEAKILARDPITDLAVLKIIKGDYPFVELGDSSILKVGQSVIAIGNALGEFRNTVSTGVISGLSRSVIAGGAGIGSEQLIGVIQTDASINPGNSGGPLLNLAGQVIGINTAMAQGAENIGFAIPINEVKDTINNVREHGRIVRPWIGVRYVMINEIIAEKNKLEVDYGALIVRGEDRTDLAVIPGSPADKAGLEENDIILDVNGEKVNDKNPLAKAIVKFKPGDGINLKVLHKGEEKRVKVILKEMK